LAAVRIAGLEGFDQDLALDILVFRNLIDDLTQARPFAHDALLSGAWGATVSPRPVLL